MTFSYYSNKIILEFDRIDWADKIPIKILSLFNQLKKPIEKTRNTYQINSSDQYLVEKFLPKSWFTDDEWAEGERALKKFMHQFEVDLL